MTTKRALDTDAAWASGGPLPRLMRTLDLLDLLDRVTPRLEGLTSNDRVGSKGAGSAQDTLAKLRGAAESDLAAVLLDMDALCVDAG
jgi:hypothetical protein